MATAKLTGIFLLASQPQTLTLRYAARFCVTDALSSWRRSESHMKLTYLMVSVAYLALTVSASGQKVEVSFDPAVDFSRFRNYALLESKNPSKLKGCPQALLDTIQVSLAKRGLLPVYDGEIPDLLIVYNAGIKEEVSIKGY